MKLIFKVTLFIFMILTIVGCDSERRYSIFQKCTTLGDESIVYARANYVKLFHYFNAEKFSIPYQYIKNFDYVTHRNVINTYDIAVRKIKAKDPITASLLFECKSLSKFSKNFVDQSYPRAIAYQSKENPLSDSFFTKINQIVKFDSKIGAFNKDVVSFKEQIANYETAKKQYQEVFKTELSK